jgi:hypothetical protein
MKGASMFYAMIFSPSEYNLVCTRSLRTKGFKTLEAAKAAIIRVKKEGYVKKLGEKAPVWSNV